MPIAQASTYNPKTKKYFAVSDSYVPDPVVWRHDLWNGVGESPATWDHVKAAAPKLKAIGHPIGIGQSQEIDSNMALIAFMMCFGSFIQNEDNRPTILSKNTVDAVKFMAEIAKNDDRTTSSAGTATRPANNNFLYSGHRLDDLQRDLGDADAGERRRRRAVRGRPLDLADPGRARTGGSGSST